LGFSTVGEYIRAIFRAQNSKLKKHTNWNQEWDETLASHIIGGDSIG